MQSNGADINIDAIFEIIDIVVSKIQKSCGGIVEFLKSENEEKLVSMYQSKGLSLTFLSSHQVVDKVLIYHICQI